jgi:hypothetical protein
MSGKVAHCIFCGDTTGKFTTREHILPESLGGGDWAILPEGLFCDVCQNRFGSEIEQQALADYPFSFLRVFIGIPTKKGKAPWFNSWEGIVRASLQPGTIGFNPAPPFEEAIFDGKKTQICLLAHPLKPDMVCRFLLKMGIEVVAAENSEDVFEYKYNPARKYALTGDKTVPWWYLQNEHMNKASHFIMQGVKETEWFDSLKLEVIKLDREQEIFHISLLYLDLFVPLTINMQPQFDSLLEPEFRIFRV